MTILNLEIISLVLFFIIHLSLWRIRLPRRQTKTLFYLAVVSIIPVIIYFGPTVPESIYLVLFHLTIVLCYMISYTLIEEDSPSSLILLGVEKNGMTKAGLQTIITDERFITSRIRGLVRDSHITNDNSKFLITAKGERFLNIFLLPRRLMGLKNAGG